MWQTSGGTNRPRNKTLKKKTMKTITTLLLAAAFSVTLLSTAKASDVLLSPRAKANQIARVKGINNDPQLVSGWYAGAAYRTYSTAPSTVASGPVKDINLVSGNYLGTAAKSPFRDLEGVQYRIAPLIEKRNASQK